MAEQNLLVDSTTCKSKQCLRNRQKVAEREVQDAVCFLVICNIIPKQPIAYGVLGFFALQSIGIISFAFWTAIRVFGISERRNGFRNRLLGHIQYLRSLLTSALTTRKVTDHKTILTEANDNGVDNKQEKSISKTRNQARQCLHIENQKSIGICGTTKGGKSSLINGLRRSKPGNPEYIKPNAIDKNTETRCYEQGDTLIFELPSTDVLDVTIEDYFEDFNLVGFDTIVFVTGPTPRERELKIASTAKKQEIECIFVRSKCDDDLITMSIDGTEQNRRKFELKQKGITVFGEEFQKFPELCSLDPENCCYFVSSVCFDPTATADTLKQFEMDERKLFQKLFPASEI